MAKYQLKQTAENIQRDLDLIESLGLEFSSSTMYYGGDIVRKDNKFYQCNSLTTYGPTEVFNTDYWDIVSLNEVKEWLINRVSGAITDHNYDASQSYSAGDTVCFKGHLYVAKGNIAAPAGTFDYDKWTKTSVEELIQAKQDLLTFNNEKSLYHLGAYDSANDNTITRQTGYLNSKDLIKLNWVYDNGVGYDNFYVLISNATPASSRTDIPYIKSNIGNVVSNTDYEGTTTGIVITVDPNKYFNIRPNTSGVTSVETFKAWISQNNLQLQYQLVTPYTEQVIKNQPLTTLDQQGSQWVRKEWEKGLNLLQEDIVKQDVWNIKLGYVNLKAGVVYNLWTDVTFPDEQKAVLKDVNDNILAFTGYTFRGNNYFKLSSNYSGQINLSGTFPDVNPTKAMLNEGSHAYPYAPYNANKHITNEQAEFLKQEWEKGLNLYYSNSYTFSAHGQTLVASGSSITLNGTNSKGADNYLDFNPFTYLEVGKTYTLKLSNVTGFALDCWVGDKHYVNDGNGLLTINLTQEIKNAGWRIVAFTDSSFNNTLINIMINEGSHAYPYESYNANKHISNEQAELLKQEWEKGLNLYDENNVINGYWINVQNGTLITSSTDCYTNYYIEVKGQTQISTYINGNPEIWCGVCFYDSNKAFISGLEMGSPSNNRPITASIPSNCKYIRISSGIAYKDNLMVNFGSHAYPYQEYNGAIVREKQLNDSITSITNQLIKVKDFDASTSSITNFRDWMISNSNNVISVMYYPHSRGDTYGKNVLFDIESYVYKCLSPQGQLWDVSLSSDEDQGNDLIRVYYK